MKIRMPGKSKRLILSIVLFVSATLAVSFQTLLLLMPSEANAQTMVTYAADPANGAVGFAHANWATSINKMLLFLGPGKDNSVRAFDPVTNQWEYLWPNSMGANGLQAPDNYVSFYVPRLDELWVWGGSYLEAIPNARRGGRFSISQRIWVATSTDDGGAFSAAIGNFGGGFIDARRHGLLRATSA